MFSNGPIRNVRSASTTSTTLKSALLCTVLATMFGSAGCAVEEEVGTSENDIKVDTSTELARRQYDANVNFAKTYTPRCVRSPRGPHVLVTGYGRFQSTTDNASGRLVELLTGATYPKGSAPPKGVISQPSAFISVSTQVVRIEGVGNVTVCGMILPVSWDLAPILAAKEMDKFAPDLVLMNGVMGGTRGVPLRIELGSANVATTEEADGSGILKAFAAKPGSKETYVLPSAPFLAQLPSRLSWGAVGMGAADALTTQRRMSTIGQAMTGVEFGRFPSPYLTYLCNNIVFVMNYLMSNPGKTVNLLEPSKPLRSTDTGVAVRLQRDFQSTPRAFIHWPDLRANERGNGVEILKAVIGAQLTAPGKGYPATPGDNVLADD